MNQPAINFSARQLGLMLLRNILLDTAKRRNFSTAYPEHDKPPLHSNEGHKSHRFAKLIKLKNLRLSPVFFIGAIAAIAVPINALFFQDGRHPAPLFSNKFNPAEAKIDLSPPTPPARPAEIAPTHDQLVATQIDNTHPHSKLRNGSSHSLALGRVNPPTQKLIKGKENEGVRKDEISHLLEMPKSAPISQDQQVLFVQHALLKLGYVVRANGIWNKTTQDALAKFQKDNGLTVKKTITSKLIVLLATRSGLESE